MKKIFIKFLYIIIISLYTFSCGLSSYSVVDPPDSDSDDAYLGFSAPSDDSNISGYEIYYKIYETDDDDIDDDEDEFDTSSDDYSYDFGVTKLNDLNFHRLMRADDGTDETLGSDTSEAPSYPFIVAGTDSDELDSGETCWIYLNLTYDYILLDSEGSSTYNGTPLRVATDDDGYFKNFSEGTSIESGDSDSNGAEDVTNYTVSFAAYSYVNSSILVDYECSYPVFLGSMDISISD